MSYLNNNGCPASIPNLVHWRVHRKDDEHVLVVVLLGRLVVQRGGQEQGVVAHAERRVAVQDPQVHLGVVAHVAVVNDKRVQSSWVVRKKYKNI